VTEVFVGIGSNIDSIANTRRALKALRTRFGDIEQSTIYESEPVGFEGDNFLNLVVRFSTDLAVSALMEELRNMEDAAGRVRGDINGYDKEFAPRTLDLDILLYGDYAGEIDGIVLPRTEITEHAHVLLPLTELAGERVHSDSGHTYTELWQAFDRPGQKLWPVNPGKP
jgi:2-amino-4-hydroxy-6-hydroxymethyldihydropteridine diphosphokinase